MSKTNYMVFAEVGDNWKPVEIVEARSPEAACKAVVERLGLDGRYAAVAESSWWVDEYVTIVKTSVVRASQAED